MKKKIIMFTLCCFTAFAATAQTKITLDGPNNLDSSKIPLVIINNFKTDLNHFAINTDNIDSLNVYKDAVTIAKYGEAGRDGVIEVYANKNTEMLNLAEILKAYSFTEESKIMKILLNNKPIKSPEKIYLDKSIIKSVELISQPGLNEDKITYINITKI